ncbi:MAG: sulfotransferase [Myxococcota bacterium]
MTEPAAGAPVLLLGSGRSGTTWLADVLNCDRTFRFLFEPFNARKVAMMEHFVFHSQYLRSSCADLRYARPIHTIVAGAIDHPWVVRRHGAATSSRLLIKDIRAHLFARWIKDQYPQSLVIFLLRHPCAVAVSRTQLGWGTHLDELLGQPSLVEDHLGSCVDRLRSIRDPFEQHVCTWAIENAVPLRQFRPAELCVVHYEHLVRRFDAEIGRLFSYLGRPEPPLEAAEVGRAPSSLAAPHSAILQGEDPIEHWRGGCTRAQIDRAIEILSWFQLDRIYGADSLPLTHASTWRPDTGAGQNR